MFSQAAGIIASNIYRADDKLLYHRGNEQLIGIAFGAIGGCLLAVQYYKWRKGQIKKKRDAMITEEQEHCKLTTTDVGNKRLDFVFIY